MVEEEEGEGTALTSGTEVTTETSVVDDEGTVAVSTGVTKGMVWVVTAEVEEEEETINSGIETATDVPVAALGEDGTPGNMGVVSSAADEEGDSVTVTVSGPSSTEVVEDEEETISDDDGVGVIWKVVSGNLKDDIATGVPVTVVLGLTILLMNCEEELIGWSSAVVEGV